MNEREDWPSENELRTKLVRNQDERGRIDTYRGDRADSGWDSKGKGTMNAEVHCFNCNRSEHY